MKKLLVIFGAVAFALVGASMFAAFEAHVVNVTATIENALTVPTTPILFGTVFPQEQIDKHLSVGLSTSFLDPNQTRVDTVTYMIRQKPKCGFTTNKGTVLVGDTKTGEVVVGDNPQTPEVETYWIDCGPTPTPVPAEGAVWGVLPSLCPYLSKHSSNQGDINVPAFHQPFTISSGTVVWTEAKGTLSKGPLDQLTADWTIDLKVPCFGGYCAQDWASFVRGINESADPAAYTQPIDNEHKVFGCDLWVETTGVTLSPR